MEMCQIRDKRTIAFDFFFFISLLSFFSVATLLFGASLVPVTFHNEGIFASVEYTWTCLIFMLLCRLIARYFYNVGILSPIASNIIHLDSLVAKGTPTTRCVCACDLCVKRDMRARARMCTL